MGTIEHTKVGKSEICIDSPAELEGEQVRSYITRMIQSGYKTNDLMLRCNFITIDAKPLFDRFQIIKNHISFNLKS